MIVSIHAQMQKGTHHQFINGLPSSINKQLRAVIQINNLDTALERAKLLMTLRRSREHGSYSDYRGRGTSGTDFTAYGASCSTDY